MINISQINLFTVFVFSISRENQCTLKRAIFVWILHKKEHILMRVQGSQNLRDSAIPDWRKWKILGVSERKWERVRASASERERKKEKESKRKRGNERESLSLALALFLSLSSGDMTWPTKRQWWRQRHLEKKPKWAISVNIYCHPLIKSDSICNSCYVSLLMIWVQL